MSNINPENVGLDHYGSVLKRRWKVVVATTLIGFLAAAGYLVAVGETSTATTDINLNVVSDDPFNANTTAAELLDATTESQIATSYAVAVKASELLEGKVTPAELRRNLEVSVISDATVISVQYSAPSAEQAIERSRAIAEAYLTYRVGQAQAKVDAVVERIDIRLDQLRLDLIDANVRDAAAESGSSAAIQASSDQDLIVTEIDALLEERIALALIDTDGGSVLSSSTENTVEVTPSTGLVLAGGFFGGLVLGLILAFLLTLTTRRVQRVEDVERASGVRALLETPAPRSASIPETGATWDSVRVARERLFATIEPAGAVVTVIDDTVGQQPSDLPVNLAIAAARAGQETLLVAPNISPDYLQLLIDRLALEVIESKMDGVLYRSVLTPGLRVGAAIESRPDEGEDRELVTYVRELITTADDDLFVLLALPPKSSHATELGAARLADATIMVASLGRTRKARISQTVEEIELIGRPFLGVLIADRKRRLRPDRAAKVAAPRSHRDEPAVEQSPLEAPGPAASSRTSRAAAAADSAQK